MLKNISRPSFAMAERGATGGRMRWIGLGFSPGKPCGSAAKTAPAKKPAPRSHTSVRRYMIKLVTVVIVVAIVVVEAGRRDDRTCRRVEDQLGYAILSATIEVEHVHDRTCRGIKRAAAETLAVQPVILDEARHRGLRDERVADEVLLREGRDHQERDAVARTAASRHRQAFDTVGLINTYTSDAGAVKGIGARERCAGDRRRGVVVLTVRVVIGEDHSGVLPIGLLLQEV